MRADTSLPAVIIVPDGLQADEASGAALPLPSFVYRAALDHVRQFYASHPIYLAPANRFGGAVSEQQAGQDYLASFGMSSIAPPSPESGYIDTQGNAAFLRHYLETQGQWPLNKSILVAASHHTRRALLCFRKSGFDFIQIDSVPYRIPEGERIVSRLWYYRYPFFHVLYEILALLRDACRV